MFGAGVDIRRLTRTEPPLRARRREDKRRTAGAMAFDRITVDPDVMGGAPRIRGLRIPVATVVIMVADGTPAETIAELPDLEPDDIPEALRYAAEAVRERQLPDRQTA